MSEAGALQRAYDLWARLRGVAHDLWAKWGWLPMALLCLLAWMFFIWGAGVPWEHLFSVVTGEVVEQAEGSLAKFLADAIIGIALVFWALFIWRWRANCADLCQALAILRSGGDNQQSFADNYNDIKGRMEKCANAKIRHNWREFIETIFEHKNADDNLERLHNTAPPHHFFVPGLLGMQSPFWSSLPGWFVSGGLLITFLGLAAALQIAVEGIGGVDMSVATDELKKLLGAAALKFMASIAGLASSIVLSINLVLYRKQADAICRDICDRLEKCLEFSSPAKVASIMLEELEKQTGALESFGTDLAMTIGEKVEAGLKSGLEKGLKPLENLGGAAKDAISNMVGTVPAQMGEVSATLSQTTKDLNAAVGGLSGIGETLKAQAAEMQNTLQKASAEAAEAVGKSSQEAGEKFAARMEQATENVGQSLAAAISGLSNVGETLQSQMQNMQNTLQQASAEATEIVSEGVQNAGQKLVTQMDETTKSVGDMVANAGEVSERMQQTVAGLADSLEQQRRGLAELIESTRSAAGTLANAAQQHGQAVQPIADAAANISEAAQSISVLGETVQKTHQELTAFLQQHDERFGEVDASLATVLKAIREQNSDYQASVVEFVTKLAGEFEKSIGHLSAAVEDLQGTLEEWQNAREGEDEQ